MPVRTGEILFVKCVKNGIPNRDPLRDSDARRIFGEDDGRISLSDVSIKRDVRDYVLSRFPEESEQEDLTRLVFVQKKFGEDGKTLLGRDGLAKAIWKRSVMPRERAAMGNARAKPKRKARRADADADSDRNLLLAAAFDMRSLRGRLQRHRQELQPDRTGPVRLGALAPPCRDALHPGDSGDAIEGLEGGSRRRLVPDEDKGKTQGTIWTQYQLPFAVFAMPGVVNATIAGQTGMSDADVDLLLAGLWKGTLHRQARGRGIQQPLMLLHVEYKDPFFRIGFLEEGLRLDTKPDEAGRTAASAGRAAARRPTLPT